MRYLCTLSVVTLKDSEIEAPAAHATQSSVETSRLLARSIDALLVATAGRKVQAVLKLPARACQL
jgi:hypothetical protein